MLLVTGSVSWLSRVTTNTQRLDEPLGGRYPYAECYTHEAASMCAGDGKDHRIVVS